MSSVEDLEYDEFAEAEEQPYRVSRLLLAPEYRDLPAEQIEAILESAFPGMEPEDAENFLSDVGRAFSNVGREIVRRGPQILAGAGQGAGAGAVAGPWGALLGAGAGAIAGGLTARPQQAPAGPGMPPGVVPPGAVPPGAGPPGAGPGPLAPAPGTPGRQLAAMFAQPQTWQAALTSLLGASGRQTLPVGGGQVPVSSILATLGTLATRAAEDLSAEARDDESAPLYLMDAEGNYAIDPANPDARAGRLLGVLSEVNLPLGISEYDARYEYDEDYEYDESDEGEMDESDEQMEELG
jgi:hypothetical protein